MRLITLTFLSAMALSAQIVVPDSFTVQSAMVNPLRASSELAAADANQDGRISNDEATVYLSSRRQNVVDTLVQRAIDEAAAAYMADQTLTTLDATTRGILDAKIAADAAWEARRQFLIFGQ